MNQVFKDIYQLVWNELFPNIEPMDIEKFKKLYTQDLLLPIERNCQIDSSQKVYSGSEYTYKKLISEKEVGARVEKDNWMEKKIPVSSLADVMDKVSKVSYFQASRSTNSDVVEESDDIYSSSYVYGSVHLYTCQKMMLCNGNKESEYLLASKGNANCSFGIRLVDSGSSTNCFDLHWCGQMANSYFCHSCYDLRDCMFCFHINSKQYCIANMQFEKEEYFKLKDILLQQYFQQVDNPTGYRTIMDL